jgi:hypothetical protein
MSIRLPLKNKNRSENRIVRATALAPDLFTAAMPVYFILDSEKDQIKIGRAKDVRKRTKVLQTGNPSPLQLMGWIASLEDTREEKRLHHFYRLRRGLGEWFKISSTEVLKELQRQQGFVPTPHDSFEIVGYDGDAVPEYLGVCEWNDFEVEECCPFCGCLCGMSFQENTSMYHCLNCDAYTNFEHPNDESVSLMD